MNVRYRVELSQIERTELRALLSGGKHASRKLKRAQILLAADAETSDEEIARSVGVSGSTVGMARSISSFSSTCIVPGARSRSPSGGRQEITPNACVILSTSIIPTPRSSGLSRTIYRPTPPAPSIRGSRPPKPGGFCDGSSSTTPQNTQAGSIWSKSKSASCGASAWIAGSTTLSDCAAKSPPRNDNEMPPAPASNGCSQQTRLAPKWQAPIPPLPKSHNHCDEILLVSAVSVSGQLAEEKLKPGGCWRKTPAPLPTRAGQRAPSIRLFRLSAHHAS